MTPLGQLIWSYLLFRVSVEIYLKGKGSFSANKKSVDMIPYVTQSINKFSLTTGQQNNASYDTEIKLIKLSPVPLTEEFLPLAFLGHVAFLNST